MGAVHEIGRSLGLNHKPDTDATGGYDPRGRALQSLRQLRNLGSTLKHDGIEGFRLARDGASGWNKSSTEGNGEEESLTSLMFPATLQPEKAFITRDYYFELLETIANRPRWQN